MELTRFLAGLYMNEQHLYKDKTYWTLCLYYRGVLQVFFFYSTQTYWTLWMYCFRSLVIWCKSTILYWNGPLYNSLLDFCPPWNQHGPWAWHKLFTAGVITPEEILKYWHAPFFRYLLHASEIQLQSTESKGIQYETSFFMTQFLHGRLLDNVIPSLWLRADWDISICRTVGDDTLPMHSYCADQNIKRGLKIKLYWKGFLQDNVL